jgi:two-component system sensor histidine kinase DesK
MTVRWPRPGRLALVSRGAVLALPAWPPLPWPRSDPRPEGMVRVAASAPSSLPMRLTATGVAAYCLVFPLTQVGVIAGDGQHLELGRAGWALAATAAYVPLYLRQILSFVRGRRAPRAGWSLAALAGIIGAATPLAGESWLPGFFALAVAVLVTAPWRWSLPAVAALAAAQVPLALVLAGHTAALLSYYPITLLWRTAAVFVPVWLAGTARQLEDVRRELAQDAVLRERLALDARLRVTLGAALASIAASGQRSAALAPADPAAAGRELAALARTSRSTLADARRLLSGLHEPALRAELETAAGLLTAAGIPTRLVLPAGSGPERSSPDFRAELRSTTARLLRDETLRGCVITVTPAGGQLRLSIRVSDQSLAALEVPA